MSGDTDNQAIESRGYIAEESGCNSPIDSPIGPPLMKSMLKDALEEIEEEEKHQPFPRVSTEIDIKIPMFSKSKNGNRSMLNSI